MGTYLCVTNNNYEILEYMESSARKAYIVWVWVVAGFFLSESRDKVLVIYFTFSGILSRLFCFLFFFSRFSVNYLLACLDRIAWLLCGAAIIYQHTFNVLWSDGKLTVRFSMFYTKSPAFNDRINLWSSEGVYSAI